MPTSRKSPTKSQSKRSAPRKSPAKSEAAASAALEGRRAPAFELADADGNRVALKDLCARGNVVLYFYPKDMTPGCTMEACSFRDNAAALRKLGATVVGVSGDSTASHAKFREKQSLNFPLLSDPDHKVASAYGVYAMKSLYGRKFMGIVRSTFVIDKSGVVRKVFPKVKVNGHTEEVIDALKALS